MKLLKNILFSLLMCIAVTGYAEVQDVRKQSDKSITLVSAVKMGNIVAVGWSLNSGADANAKDIKSFEPALNIATQIGRKDIVELLIANGANVNARGYHFYNTPLFIASENGHRDVVELLIAKGADVNLSYPLIIAIEKGHKDIIELLVAKGVDVNADALMGNTPLHYAALKGYRDVAELLISKGADVDARNIDGKYTPLHVAVIKMNQDVVELLISKGASVNSKNEWELTPLHHAAQKGSTSSVPTPFPKDSGSNNGTRNNGYLAIAELLIEHGADVYAIDTYGTSPLMYAAKNGNKDIAELLIAKGADVNIHGGLNYTSLHHAAYGGHKDVVELLIAKGADVNAYSNAGTPMTRLMERRDGCKYFAANLADCERHCDAIAELLRQHGGS